MDALDYKYHLFEAHPKVAGRGGEKEAMGQRFRRVIAGRRWAIPSKQEWNT